MKEEEIIAAFIPHMIETAGGGYAGITKAIQADNFEWDGKKSDYICSRRIYSRSFEQTDEKALSTSA